MTIVAPSLPFSRFAETCDAARSEPGKLGKISALASYIAQLPPHDIPRAVRFFVAQPFPASSGKSLGVGGALVVESLRRILAVDRVALNRAFAEHGELAEAVSSFWPRQEGEGLTLSDVELAFENLRITGVQEEKIAHLIALLNRAGNREAVYLLKIILGDMRTGVSDGVVEAAVAKAFDVSLPRLRAARQLEGDLDAVADLAATGRLAEARFRPFTPLNFMLAQPVLSADEIVATLANRPAIAEDKYDGIRAQAHAAAFNGSVRSDLFSRGSGSVTAAFPEIVSAINAFAAATGRQFVLDGEIVPMRLAADGSMTILPFSVLQRRLGRKILTPKLLRENPCAFVAFDLLWLDDQLYLERPLADRRHALADLHAAALAQPARPLPFALGPVTTVTSSQALQQAFDAARLRRNEGLVIKQLDSLYTPGRRGDAWLKLKSHLPTLDCVVIGVERGHGKRAKVLSDVTFAVRASQDSNDNFLTVGKAYSGLTDVEIAALTDRFRAETIEQRGRYHVLRPTLVLEIAFDQITKSDRHNSGYAMRFPRIVRIRNDKTPRDADTIDRVREIFLSPDNLAVGEPTGPAVSDADQLTLF